MIGFRASTYKTFFLGICMSTVLFYSCKEKVEKKQVKEVAVETFSNPIDVEFGDPFVLDNGDGTFYMYGTGQVENGFATYSSNDLVKDCVSLIWKI